MSTLLNTKHGKATVLMAVVCSSWIVINMGSSGRHISHPLGRDDSCPKYVEMANNMVARCLGHVEEKVFLLYPPNLICISGGQVSLRAVPPALQTTPSMLGLRMCLLVYLAEAMSCTWLVEQPSSSLLRYHPRVMDTFSLFRVTRSVLQDKANEHLCKNYPS